MASSKQTNWQKRNNILWRLKGFGGFSINDDILTPEEQALLRSALECVYKIINDNVASSRKLGFNASYRCKNHWCNKPISDERHLESGFCEECEKIARERNSWQYLPSLPDQQTNN